MIRIHLGRLLGEKRMHRSQLQRQTDLSKNTIARLYHSKTELISLKTLNQICQALDCEVGDLLEYQADDTDVLRSESLKTR